jgi:hypothetical protein
VRITASLNIKGRHQRRLPVPSYLSDPGGGVLRDGPVRAQPVTDTFYLAALKLTAGLGAGELTAVTSYFDRTAAAGRSGSESSRRMPTRFITGDKRMWSRKCG